LLSFADKEESGKRKKKGKRKPAGVKTAATLSSLLHRSPVRNGQRKEARGGKEEEKKGKEEEESGGAAGDLVLSNYAALAFSHRLATRAREGGKKGEKERRSARGP